MGEGKGLCYGTVTLSSHLRLIDRCDCFMVHFEKLFLQKQIDERYIVTPFMTATKHTTNLLMHGLDQHGNTISRTLGLLVTPGQFAWASCTCRNTIRWGSWKCIFENRAVQNTPKGMTSRPKWQGSCSKSSTLLVHSETKHTCDI